VAVQRIGGGHGKWSRDAMRAREWRKEEESDFASSLGQSGEGIRVTGRLEAAHAVGGHQRHTVTIYGVARAHDRCVRLGGVCD
jgi:hypothetical protein